MQSLTAAQLQSEYIKNAVIPPPDVNTVNTKQTRLLVASASRDVAKYPSPSEFSVSFERIHFVTKVELIASTIPFSSYTVDHTNNIVYFSEENTAFDPITHMQLIPPSSLLSVTVPAATYTGPSLALALQSLLNSATRSTIAVSYDPATNKLGMASDLTDKSTGGPAPFTLSFMNKGQKGTPRATSASSVLGYAIADYYGALKESVSLGAADTTFTLHDTSALVVGDTIVFATTGGTVFNKITAINRSTGIVSLKDPIVATFTYGVVLYGRYPAPFVMNLTPRQLVCLHVSNMAKNVSTTMNDGLDQSFAVIYKHFPAEMHNHFKTLSPPLSTLEKMAISLRNADGSTYDCQNQDYVLEFVVTYNNGAINS